MKLYHKTIILPLAVAAFSACATQFRTKITLGECVCICSPLVPYGFRPMWNKQGVCACLVPPSERSSRNHINTQEGHLDGAR